MGSEHLFAFLDDVCIVTRPDRVAHSFSVIQEQLRRHSNIRVHLGKIKVWNASGERPRDCDILQCIADASDSNEPVWRGSDLPTDQQGIRVLGTPLGHEDFVAAHLAQVLRKHQTLLERIPMVQDVQCAWALLLHSAASRANYQVRVVRPELTGEFGQGHDEGVWRCLCNILRVHPESGGGLARGHCEFAAGFGRIGPPKRSPNEAVSLLGKLGRHSPDGYDEAPSNRGGVCGGFVCRRRPGVIEVR